MGMRKIYDNKNSKSQIETVRNAWIESMKRTPYELNGRPAVSFGDMWVMTWRNWLMIDCEGERRGSTNKPKKTVWPLNTWDFIHFSFYSLHNLDPQPLQFELVHIRLQCITVESVFNFSLACFLCLWSKTLFFSNKNCFGFFFVWINVSIRRLQVMR